MPISPEQIKKRKMRALERERLTNLFMINMVWSVVGLIVLLLLYNNINNAVINSDKIAAMETSMWVVFGVSLAGSAALFFMKWKGIAKNPQRFQNYAVFLIGIALCALWILFYNDMRLWLATFNPWFKNINSGFRFWTLMYLIPVYLVGAFVYYLIRMRKLKK